MTLVLLPLVWSVVLVSEHSDHSGLQHEDPHRGQRSMKHR